MSYILTLIAGILIGFFCGLMVFRKNSSKLQDLEHRVKQMTDSIKK